MTRLRCWLVLIAAIVFAQQVIAQQQITRGKTFSSPLGKRTRVVLPDHSVATLNSNSTLTLDKAFTVANRLVSVSGDVLFEIKAGNKSFRIFTPHLVITVPTAAIARVNGYATSPGEETLLFSGKLHAVKSYYSALDHDPYDLKAGEMVMMNKDIDLMEKETFSLTEEQPWVKDDFTVTNCSPSELLKKLKDWFNVEIVIATAYSPNLRYSGSFQGMSLQGILDEIAKTWKFRYTVKDNLVTIRF